MATLTQEQLTGLNAATQRLISGTASQGDIANIDYAKKNYGYTTKNAFIGNGYQYLGDMTSVQNAIKQYGSDRVKAIAGDYYILPSAVTAPTTNTSIPIGELGQGTDNLSKILGANVSGLNVNSDISGLLSILGQTTPEQKNVTNIQGKITEDMSKLGGQSADYQAELEKQGVPTMTNQLKELNLKAAQLQGELEQFDVQTQQLSSNIEGQSISTGLIRGQQAQLQKQRDLTRMGKAAELAATTSLAQAYQGNITLSQQLAQQAIDLKYKPIQNELDTLKTQLGFATDAMNTSDTKRANIITQLINLKQADIDEQKATDSKIQDLIISAAGNGAPLNVVTAMRGAKTPEEAAQIAGQYLTTNVAQGNADKIEQLVITASGNGAPASVISQMRGAKDAVTAAQIAGTWLTRTDQIPTKKTGSGSDSSGSDYVTQNNVGGLNFFDKNDNPITAGQYAASTKQNLISILQQSGDPADQGQIQEIQYMIENIKNKTFTVAEAYAEAQQAKSQLFNGVSLSEFKTMLGI